MRILDLINFLKSNIAYTFIANEFSANAPDDCAVVRLTGGLPPNKWVPVYRPSFQVLVRAKSTGTAEAKAQEIYDFLHGRKFFVVGNTEILSCFSDTSTPLYLGRDSNDRTLYSLNFTCTTKPI